MKLTLSLFIFLSSITNAIAQENSAPRLTKIVRSPVFDLPLDCTLDQDCWVMNYVDMTPDDGKNTDHQCLSRTYDTHKGTDFALLDGAAMAKGVNVLAPMDGTVYKIRDGEEDGWRTPAELKTIQDQRKECGNAVLINHDNDIQTVYCHLKKNSIAVKPDQKIKRGDVIGQVGLSGFTQFPHLHFGILKDRKVIDPFTGKTNLDKCGEMKAPLWRKSLDVHYQPLIIQSVGFDSEIPELNKIEQRHPNAKSISKDAEIISFWAVMLGARAGDIINLEIRDPNNNIVAQDTITQEKNRARQFYYIGKKLNAKPLMEGAYSGNVNISRTNKNADAPQIWRKESAILVAP